MIDPTRTEPGESLRSLSPVAERDRDYAIVLAGLHHHGKLDGLDAHHVAVAYAERSSRTQRERGVVVPRDLGDRIG